MLNARTLTYALFATGGLAATAAADLRIWTGAGGDSNWSNAANWSGNSVPGSQDTAYIDPGFTTIVAPFGVSVGSLVTYRPIVFNQNVNIINTSHFYADVSFNGGLTIYQNDAVINVYRSLNWNGGYCWRGAGTTNTTIQVNSGGAMNVGPGAGPLANHVAVMNGGTLSVNTTSLNLLNTSSSDIVVLSTQPGGSMNFNVGCVVGTSQVRPSAGAVINAGQVTTRNGSATFTDSVYFYNSGKLRAESPTYIGDPAFLPVGDNYVANGEYELVNSTLAFSGGRTVKGISNAARITLSGPGAYFAGIERIQSNEGVLTVLDGAYPWVGYGRAVGFNNYGTLSVYPGSYVYSSTRFTNASTGSVIHFARGTAYGDNGYVVTPEYVNVLGGYAQLIAIDGYQPSLGDRIPMFRVTDESPYYGAYGGFSGVFASGWDTSRTFPSVEQSYHAFDYVIGCRADFNGDGFLDGFDYDDFVACFEGVACPATKTADYNGDGFADGFDYDDFVAAFEFGC